MSYTQSVLTLFKREKNNFRTREKKIQKLK